MALKDAENKPVPAEHIRELDTEALEGELAKLREAQFRLRFRAATESLEGENALRFRVMRRNVARILTVLRERQQA